MTTNVQTILRSTSNFCSKHCSLQFLWGPLGSWTLVRDLSTLKAVTCGTYSVVKWQLTCRRCCEAPLTSAVSTAHYNSFQLSGEKVRKKKISFIYTIIYKSFKSIFTSLHNCYRKEHYLSLMQSYHRLTWQWRYKCDLITPWIQFLGHSLPGAKYQWH